MIYGIPNTLTNIPYLPGLNLTANPDANYRKSLLNEVKEWKRLVRNAVTEDSLSNRSSIPNVSSMSNSENNFLFKIKTYVEEQPDLDQFIKDNATAFEKANEHLINFAALHRHYNAMCDQKEKLLLEVSNDLRDEILLDC